LHHKANCGRFKDIPVTTAVRDHGATSEGRANSSKSKGLLSISQVFSIDVLEGSDASNARIQLKIHSC